MEEERLTFEGGRYQEKLHSVLAKTAFLLDNTYAIEPEGVASGFYATRITRPERHYREVMLAMGIDGITAQDPEVEDYKAPLSYPTYDYYIAAQTKAEFDSGVYPRVQSGAIISTANGETSGYISRVDLTAVSRREYSQVPRFIIHPSAKIEVVNDEHAIEQLKQESPREAANYLAIAELALDAMIEEYTFRRAL